jgi:hypothetical protein
MYFFILFNTNIENPSIFLLLWFKLIQKINPFIYYFELS